MNSAHQLQFIDSCKLQDWEKDELKRVDNKSSFYQSRIKWYDLHEAQSKARNAHVFLLKNGIFFSEELRKAFQNIDDMIWEAVTEHQMNIEHPDLEKERKKIHILSKGGESLLRELEGKVRNRIWPQEKVAL